MESALRDHYSDFSCGIMVPLLNKISRYFPPNIFHMFWILGCISWAGCILLIIFSPRSLLAQGLYWATFTDNVYLYRWTNSLWPACQMLLITSQVARMLSLESDRAFLKMLSEYRSNSGGRRIHPCCLSQNLNVFHHFMFKCHFLKDNTWHCVFVWLF